MRDAADDPFAEWAIAPDDLRLIGEEVHVWGWSLSGSRDELAQREVALSGDELARMRSFRFVADAEQFAWSRGGLREILGSYLGVTAEAIRFVYGKHGKPALAQDQGSIHFNLSHTQSVALAAFTLAEPIGIDVEERRTVSRTLGKQTFSERELLWLQTLSNEEYTIAFFNLWTKKEAIVKAEGLGFSLPTQAFSVILGRGESTQIEDPRGVLSRDWRMVELRMGGAVAACVATTSASAVTTFRKE